MPELVIRSLEADPMPIPLSRPISSALGTYSDIDCVLVSLHTDGGLAVGL